MRLNADCDAAHGEQNAKNYNICFLFIRAMITQTAGFDNINYRLYNTPALRESLLLSHGEHGEKP
jgi:hypothetical protein